MTATYKAWAAADVLAAADVMTYLMKQANIKCTDTSDRPGTPAEAWRAMLTSLDREETYDGSAWQRTNWWGSAGRTGGIWSRASTFAVGVTTDAYISWDTEAQDTDGFLAHHATTGTTATIPTGLGGLYFAAADLIFDGDPGANRMWLEWGSTPMGFRIDHTEAGSAARFVDGGPDYYMGLSGFCVMNPNDTLKVGIRDAGGEDVIGGHLALFRIAI